MNPPRQLRALRGATTVPADEPAEIDAAVAELLNELVAANALQLEDIVSVFFSATPDITSAYPAAGARKAGWTEIAMLCMQEMDVVGAPPRCIRVLLHVMQTSGRTLRHVYLREAQALRPDWAAPQ